MFVEIDGINIFYESNIGEGAPILLLHGWGASTQTMRGIFKFLASQNKTVYSLDFPGFGASFQPDKSWGVYEYADMVNNFIVQMEITSPIVLAHSFGGRIAIVLASRNQVSKLILVDSAGLKPKFSLARVFKICKYKIKKKLKLNTAGMGSTDYLLLSDTMKSVFVKVVNAHLDNLLKDINVPTLLIWGENDLETPLYMAKKMNKFIKNSGLVVLNKCGHFCFADSFIVFCKVIIAFM